MQTVLILGNITKDIYLRLDNHRNRFESDQNHTEWLDLAFNGSTHPYFSRASIYGGASISLEVLSRFGINASISGSPATFLDGQFVAKDSHTVYRYILCHDDKVSYLSPSQPAETTWQAPSVAPSWIFADNSAHISPSLARELNDFLDLHHETRLAIAIDKHSNHQAEHLHSLIDRAALILTNAKALTPRDNVVIIADSYIEYQGQRTEWSLDQKQAVMTHLSARLTIAASVFGAIALNKSTTDALLIARTNVENSNLGSSLNLQTIESEITDDYYQVQSKQSNQQELDLASIASQLVASGKGILAADESGGSIHKKFESLQIPDDETHRRDYRNIFLGLPDLSQYVNGVILFDETAHQKADNSQNFVEFLHDNNILAGIKVDRGLVKFEDSDETYTDGLDGLAMRLGSYYELGARFAKWRAAFTVDSVKGAPSDQAINRNAEILAEYAKVCQDANIVPIIEPELVYDGNYSIDQSIEFTGKILDQTFAALAEKQVYLPGCILKVNMILAGKQYHTQSTAEEIGRTTAEVLRDHVPRELAGVVFLSGGQSVEQATDSLQAVINNGPFPWPVTFSFARALQEPALQAWRGDNDNIAAARSAFKARLVANCNALKRQI